MKNLFAVMTPTLPVRKPFIFALEHNATIWSPPLGQFRDGVGLGDGTRCAADSLACFFEPWSNCEAAAGDQLCRDGGPVPPDCVARKPRGFASKE